MHLRNPKQPTLAVVEEKHPVDSVCTILQAAQPTMSAHFTEKGSLHIVIHRIDEDKNKTAEQWQRWLLQMSAVGMSGIVVMTMLLRIG